MSNCCRTLKPFAYEAITVSNTAIGFTAATIRPSAASAQTALRATVTAETAQMRYRIDGSNPTSSEGHLLEISDVLVLDGPVALLNFRAIRTGATDGTLRATYER